MFLELLNCKQKIINIMKNYGYFIMLVIMT